MIEYCREPVKLSFARLGEDTFVEVPQLSLRGSRRRPKQSHLIWNYEVEASFFAIAQNDNCFPVVALGCCPNPSLPRRPLHKSPKATHIVILKERRIRRELKDLDFSCISMKRRKGVILRGVYPERSERAAMTSERLAA
jgi:hypothetical protein